VSDSIDTDLANRMLATMYLLEQKHDWLRIARDESLLQGVRDYAEQRAQAIKEELAP
jgi:hypothetical protein